jgi:hypothetical protein
VVDLPVIFQTKSETAAAIKSLMLTICCDLNKGIAVAVHVRGYKIFSSQDFNLYNRALSKSREESVLIQM